MLQTVEPLVVAEHREILVGEGRAPLLDVRPHLVAFLGRVQPQARAQALQHRGVAAGAAEDEGDRGQQPLAVQPVDDVHPAGYPDPPGRAPSPVSVGAPVVGLGVPLLLAPQPHQLRVDLAVLVVHEEVEQPVPHQDVLPQRHRPVLLDDDLGLAAHGLQPLAELLGVGHRRRQGGERHGFGKVDDHLLPGGAPERVGEVVHLVHDDVPEAVESPRARVEHVAQHLGRHDHDRRLAVDGVVAGQ